MNLVTAQGIEKNFGERTLFRGVSFAIGERERVGLVGANGTGKTTLLRMLCGEDTPDAGTLGVQCRPGVMEQDFAHMRPLTLLDAALEVFAPLMAMEAELERINERLEAGENDSALISRQHTLTERHADDGGLTYRSRSRAALLGLGFGEAQLTQPVSSLSGGEQAKLRLARLLLQQSPLLLLDEPTNHLDIPAMEWLEEMLRGYSGAMLIISHDRWFLDRVTQRTFLLDNNELRTAEAPYTEAMRRFGAQDEQTAHHALHTRREIQRLEQIIAQQRRWNRERNIRMAESKQKVVDKLQKTLPDEKKVTRAPTLAFTSLDETSTDLLQAEGLAKSFGGRLLFSGVSVHVRARERLFILGPNGCGKTTLLKLLALTLAPDAGVVELGPRVRVGYYDQAQAGLHPGYTLLQEMTEAAGELSQLDLRNALAGMGFRGDEVYKPIDQLSGGERARICLLKLMLSPAHLLLLDEPTNHLDIISREALEEALLHYDGALIVISHDRYFIRRLGARMALLTPSGLTDVEGMDFSALSQAAKAPAENAEGLLYREKKAREALLRKREAQLQRCEKGIAALEREMDETRARMADPALSSDYERLAQLHEQLDELSQRHDEQLALWLTLQE